MFKSCWEFFVLLFKLWGIGASEFELSDGRRIEPIHSTKKTYYNS